MENLESKIAKIIKKHYSQILSDLEDIVDDIDDIDLTIELTDSRDRGFYFKLGI